MKTNMGKIDRTIRVVVAIAIAALYFFNILSGTIAAVLLVLALVFVVTGFIGFCPLYLPFGISTLRRIKKAV
jgi:hypothetical protein